MRTESNTGSVSGSPDEVSIERPALYVVATPIGNLSDITHRAIAVLAAVDLVLCEDTRHSRRLFDRYHITTPVKALHDHNERKQAPELVHDTVARNLAVALISDSGTPLISDPGFSMVQSAVAKSVPIYPIPGPCASIAALSVAGLATDRFHFEGFLPAQAGARRLRELQHYPQTLVFYETPHRIVASLDAMVTAFGESRSGVVLREMTKRFESVYRGRIADVCADIANDRDNQRGEFVVLVEGAVTAVDLVELDRVISLLRTTVDKKETVRLASAITGVAKNEVYARVLELDASSAD